MALYQKEIKNPDGTTSFVGGATEQDVNAAITAQSLTPTAPIQVPPVPTDTNNYQGLTAGGNAVVGANNLTLTPPAPTDTGVSDLQAMITAMGQPPSASAQYGSDYAASGIPGLQTTANVDVAAVKASQARLAAINAQLAGITAEAQAIPIQQQKDAEGRGITAAGLAPITTAALRNNALRALPLQAQALGVQAEVAAAQGNAELSQSILQQAQDHLDKVFQIHSTDATNQYNYRKDVLGKIYDSLTAKEKARADALQKQRDQDFTLMTNNLNNAQALAKMAIENGQGALAAKISALDPKSQTYTKDLASLQGQIRPKVSGGGTTTKSSIDSGQPIVVPNDPTKTTAQNNMQTLQQVFQSSKVSAGNRTSIGNGLALAQAAQDLANANIDGTFSGFSPFRAVTDIKIPFTNIGLPFREALKRNKTIQNEAMISSLDLQTQFWASGAALSDAQTELVKKMIPTVNNTDTQIRTKVNQLINYMLSQTSSRLVTDGIDFKPAKVDVFETVNLLDKASPEQQAQLKAAGLIP